MKALFFTLGFVMLVSFLKASGFSVTSDDKTFFRELRTAVLNDDREKFAGLMVYPITVRIEGESITLANSGECVLNYGKVVSEKLRASIKAQDEDGLVKNWRGVMVGDGEVWFDRIKRSDDREFVYKIIGLNP